MTQIAPIVFLLHVDNQKRNHENDKKIHERGQSLWLDNITRGLLTSDTLGMFRTAARRS